MTFYLFIDETGDHGLKKINHEFPLFLLCGVLVKQEDYARIRESFNSIKNHFWGNEDVIFHSRDIRKCERDFVNFLDHKIKSQFYDRLNLAMDENEFTVVATAIKKNEFVATYNEIHNDAYELALTMVFNQIFIYLMTLEIKSDIQVIIERRGKKEDRKLEEHFKFIRDFGTDMFSANQIENWDISVRFRNKKENINGLQLADLLAYPIAKYILKPGNSNISFEIIEKKIFKNEGKLLGIRIIP